ncbi:phosphoserine phosphatase SerB [endosymbiont of unidentified scaly snail isolate Monju]|uniref:phosphoserine phosphatase SerB n=1 Tax=endosymbiont of unidentified scaly snail isolate Monju TaxID=1248727 RepID=UPI0003892B46|nr:phosphoserine phosphatase SerB [endosymbiont of unidentified scaly snail isolate Monju]BAN69980.1 phosphoserine phosphatase/ACT domain-containing protein [endosymbiont of unidentified scaly snail isolate Monju]
MRPILLLNITGPDHPGLTAELAAQLARHGVNVLDIGQAVIHDRLNLGMLLEVPETEDAAMRRALQHIGDQHGLHAEFTTIAPDDYEHWVAAEGRPRFIATLLGRKLGAANIAHLAQVAALHGLNIDGITRLSGRFSLRADEPRKRACVEFSLRGEVADEEALRHDLLAITRDDEVDVAFQRDDLYRRQRRLVVFDMDSTLIQCEVIDELARAAGTYEEVAAITEAAMRGEIPFDESFRRRLATLEGLEVSVLERIARELPITEGADRLITTLKRLGYKVGILSGGFTYFAEHLKQRWGLDCVSANELDIEDGRLTGRVKGEIVNGEKKAELLQRMAQAHGIDMRQTVAVGDGANDLPMLSIAGLGIAFHAKPVVRERARHSISTLGLDGILYLLGVRDREVPA